MANKISVELSANVTGFKQGMEQATESAQQYQTETRKISDSLTSFNKQMRDAKREVQNLALAYSKLSKEEKQSNFGLEMKTRLDAAKKSAAEFVDMQGDMQTELKNLASDTRVFDTMAEGLTIASNVASGALGIYAQLTGEEEDAKRAMVAFTTAQSVLNAATTIHNALQMQSQTMLAVTKVQTLAATAAIKLKTAAEGKSVVTTKAATVAQAMFNKIAYMNPYVLLAMALVGLVAALGTFVVWSGKSRRAQEEENKAKERAKTINDEYYSSLNKSLSDTIPKYIKLQTEWKNLRTEAEKTQWIKDNQDEFHNLGVEVNNIGDAENFLVKNTEAVKEAFMARARAAAMAAMAAKEYQLALEESPKAGDKMSVNDAYKYGLSLKNRNIDTHWFKDNEITLTADEEAKIRQQKLKEAEKNIGKQYDEMSKEEKKSAKKLADAGVKAYIKQREKATKAAKTSTTKTEEILDPESLKAAEKKLHELEEKRTKLNVDSSELPKLIKDIEAAKKDIESKKIKLGITIVTEGDQIEKYQKQLEDNVKSISDKLAAHQLGISILSTDQYIELDDQLEKAKTKLEAFKTALEQVNGVQVSGDSSISKILNGEYDNSINGLQNAISHLQDHLAKVDWSSEDGVNKYDKITKLVGQLNEKLQEQQQIIENDTKTPKQLEAEKLEKTVKSYEDLADILGEVGNAFSSLSQIADDDKTLNVMGIVAQAIATVALSYAKALASCKTWVDWLAFGVTGLGTMLSMVAQIKQATSGYATGGIVGGSSYSGDNVYARLNAGEMVLNKHQQQNLFDAINSGNIGNNNNIPQSIEVYGRIKGTDILLSNHNTQKVMSRSGLKIHN